MQSVLLGSIPLSVLYLAETVVNPVVPTNMLEFLIQNSSATVLTGCLMLALKWQEEQRKHEQLRNDEHNAKTLARHDAVVAELKADAVRELSERKAELKEKEKEIKYLNEKIIEIANFRQEEEDGE